MAAPCAPGVCCEPEGYTAEVDWSYVGPGRGGYEKVEYFQYVGQGSGEFDRSEKRSYYGIKLTVCCAFWVCSLSLLALIAAVVFAVLYFQRYAVAVQTATTTTTAAFQITPRTNSDVSPLVPFHCQSGDLTDPERRLWCCQNQGIGCQTAPSPAPVAGAPASFDCVTGFWNWQAAWSQPQKDWCCAHVNRGCPSAR